MLEVNLVEAFFDSKPLAAMGLQRQETRAQSQHL